MSMSNTFNSIFHTLTPPMAIAVANSPAGIDIEHLDSKFEFWQVVNLVLCKKEKYTLACTPPQNQQVPFFKY